MTKPAGIFIVDDHQIVRDGLRLLLTQHPEFEFVGWAFDVESGWRGIQQLKPELVVLDLELPGASGMSLLRRLREDQMETKVVILTGHSDPHLLAAAVRAGADGCVLKSAPGSELLACLHAALAGRVYLCPGIATLVVREYQRQEGRTAGLMSALTARELEVLRLIAAGQNTKEIAFALGVSPKTIETHRLSLLKKLNVKSVAELTKFAVREGLTTL